MKIFVQKYKNLNLLLIFEVERKLRNLFNKVIILSIFS